MTKMIAIASLSLAMCACAGQVQLAADPSIIPAFPQAPVDTASRWAGAAQMAGLPDEGGVELIAVPFPGAVAFGEVSDLNRNEVLAWREWYDRQFKAWEQMRKGKARCPII
jgi:hypothetical protein